MKIGIIGLGKLGLCMAAIFGQKYETVGIDVDSKLIEKIRNKEVPYKEENLKEYLDGANLSVYTDFHRLKGCEVIFCIVPTPSTQTGEFTNKYIYDAIIRSQDYMDKCKLFVVTSTIMPGSSELIKDKLPEHVKLCYSPEFIALGNVIYGMEYPDVVLLGEEDKESGDLLYQIYFQIIKNGAPIKRMSWISAEIAKIALNSYVTMKISFANVLGEICEQFEGADVDDITELLGADSRIGKKFLNSSVPYGGPCFPRDNKAFGRMLINKHIEGYNDLTDKINHNQINRIMRTIEGMLGRLNNKMVGIYGMGYKVGSDLRFDSPSEWIKEKLLNKGITVKENDLVNSDLIILMLPGEFKGNIDTLKKMKTPKVLDCWRDRPDLGNITGVEYKCLGKK